MFFTTAVRAPVESEKVVVVGVSNNLLSPESLALAKMLTQTHSITVIPASAAQL